MTFPNTAYPRSFAAAAHPGQIGDTGDHQIEAHRNAEGANVPAGIFVTSLGDEQFGLIDGSTEPILGVVLNSFARDPNAGGTDGLSGTDAIKDGATAPIMTEGQVWVVCEEAMAVNDPIYVRHTANGAGKLQLGAVRNDSDSANARQTKGARVVRGSSAAGVVLLEIDGLLDRATL